MNSINATGPSGFYFSSRVAILKNIQAIVKVAADKRNAPQKAALLKWFGPRDVGWAKLNQAEQDHLKQQPKPKITTVFAARKNGVTYNFGADTRKVYFLTRGNSNSKQGLANPGFLQVLTDRQAKEQQWLQTAANSAKPNAKPNAEPNSKPNVMPAAKTSKQRNLLFKFYKTLFFPPFVFLSIYFLALYRANHHIF